MLVGQQALAAAWCEALGQLHRGRHLGAQRVDREIQKHRARLTALAPGARDGFVQRLQHQLGLAHGAGIARERAQVGMMWPPHSANTRPTPCALR